jgi:hypothetical protein
VTTTGDGVDGCMHAVTTPHPDHAERGDPRDARDARRTRAIPQKHIHDNLQRVRDALSLHACEAGGELWAVLRRLLPPRVLHRLTAGAVDPAGSASWAANWLRLLAAPVATPVRAGTAVAVLTITVVIVLIAHAA